MGGVLSIVGHGGSIASVSRSRIALEVALEGAASARARTRLLDLRALDLPMFNPDAEYPTHAAAELIEACHTAHGLLRSSPLDQGTIEVVRVADRFAADDSLHRATEYEQAAERVATA